MTLSLATAGEFTTFKNDQGIDLFFDYTAEVMSNVSGGDHTGTGYNGLASFGVEADLGQALGWQGLTLRLSGMDLHGSGIGSRVGDMLGVSNIEGYGSVRLYESWVEKSFADESLSLRVGLLLADEEFSTLDTAGLFLNSTFGWPEFISMNTVNTGPAFYIPALGLRLLWEPSEAWYGQVGVFDGDTFDSPAGDDTVNRHGLHSELGNGQGIFGMVEIGYRHNQADDADGLPGTYKLGGWWHSGEFDDFRGGASHDGIQGVYASGEQMVYREYGDQGLNLFVRVGFAPKDRSASRLQFSGWLELCWAASRPRHRHHDSWPVARAHQRRSARAHHRDGGRGGVRVCDERRLHDSAKRAVGRRPRRDRRTRRRARARPAGQTEFLT